MLSHIAVFALLTSLPVNSFQNHAPNVVQFMNMPASPDQAAVGEAVVTVNKTVIDDVIATVQLYSGSGWKSVPNKEQFLLPLTALSKERLENIKELAVKVLEQNVPGDFVETGVFHGGGSAILASSLKAAGNPQNRQLWCADSFKGLPPNSAKDAEADKAAGKPMDFMNTDEEHKNSLAAVKQNFKGLGVADVNIKYLEGWFNETIPSAPIDKIALLRLDGDMYTSTMDVLTALYPKVTPGGYVIVDDYGYWPQCKQAVTDYFQSQGANPTWNKIDETGVWMQKA